ncbi:hypothetical protein Tco_0072399 [Tanacetum coccineum]|uniref:Uncharacterized protein n=1 Tax=Tanacetum coccineum TaxID=301880 RepID=A0ABQ4XHJ5_9ASTR
MKEFAPMQLAHILSPAEYDQFCLKIEKPELGNLTMDVVNDIFPTREPRVHVPNFTHPSHPGYGYSRIVKASRFCHFKLEASHPLASFWESVSKSNQPNVLSFGTNFINGLFLSFTYGNPLENIEDDV